MIEICNECGRSVSFGTRLYVNRVIDFDDYETRKLNGKPFPEGDFICVQCERKLRKNERKTSYQKSKKRI